MKAVTADWLRSARADIETMGAILGNQESNIDQGMA
jgi:hypothetical protein